jgi:hypothetical protein
VVDAFDFAGWRRDGYRHGDTVDDQLEIKFSPPQLFVRLRKFPGSRLDALIEFLGKALLLAQLPCRLQTDRCQIGRDIQEKTFGQARELRPPRSDHQRPDFSKQAEGYRQNREIAAAGLEPSRPVEHFGARPGRKQRRKSLLRRHAARPSR